MFKADLQAPTMLIAMPQVRDPFFHQGVVLLASHDQDGSLGFVVNNATNLTLGTVLEDLKISWSGDEREQTLLGGPVDPQLGTVLLPSTAVGAFEQNQTQEIAPGISITRDLDVLRALAGAPPPGLRLLLGHAGWSPGQLDEEVERHDWLICPVDSALLFEAEVAALWERSLASLGLEQGGLPAWAMAGPTASSETVN